MDLKEVGITRREVEAKLATVGDYVKMDYLSACLKKNMDFDTKKYVLTTLAGIYEGRKMYLESAKLIRAAAEINATFEGKMNDFMKSTELYIKAGVYEEADISFTKSLACAQERQKESLRTKRKTVYKAVAEEYIKKDKRNHAVKAYEKMLSLPELSSDEKKNVQGTLAGLYQKLGKIKEYYAITRSSSQ